MRRRTRASYDAVAERYAAELSSELAGKPLDRALLLALAELAKGGLVLDVGCGPGHVARWLTDSGLPSACLDLSTAMCSVGRRATGLPFAAADMTALPVRDRSVSAVVCFYALIHLDEDERRAAYAEFTRVLCDGGHLLVAFHVRDPEVVVGGSKTIEEWWEEQVDLCFRFLSPEAESEALGRAGFELVARLDRSPHAGVEHESDRCYLLARPVGSKQRSAPAAG